MPTSTGLLKAGDRIQGPDGVICVVIERLSSTADYSVRVRREDGENWHSGEAAGKPAKLLLTAAWKLDHGWKLLPPVDSVKYATLGERESMAQLAAVKANLASLNEIVAELAQRVAGASDSEFVELVLGILKGHSFDLGFEFQGERGPSSYDPVIGELGGRDFAAENPDKCANCGEAVVPRDVGMGGRSSWKHQNGGTVLCIVNGVRTGAHAELRESAG
jgi:hypothetical protein